MFPHLSYFLQDLHKKVTFRNWELCFTRQFPKERCPLQETSTIFHIPFPRELYKETFLELKPLDPKLVWRGKSSLHTSAASSGSSNCVKQAHVFHGKPRVCVIPPEPNHSLHISLSTWTEYKLKQLPGKHCKFHTEWKYYCTHRQWNITIQTHSGILLHTHTMGYYYPHTQWDITMYTHSGILLHTHNGILLYIQAHTQWDITVHRHTMGYYYTHTMGYYYTHKWNLTTHTHNGILLRVQWNITVHTHTMEYYYTHTMGYYYTHTHTHTM